MEITKEGRVFMDGVEITFTDDDDVSSTTASTGQSKTWSCGALERCRERGNPISEKDRCPLCHSLYQHPPRISVREMLKKKNELESPEV